MPKYEAAALELERAERNYGNGTGDAVQPAWQANSQADVDYNAKLTTFGTAASDLSTFDKGMEDRKVWLPATCIFLIGVGALLLARTPAVAALERLDLGHNGLTLRGVTALERAGAAVFADDQHAPGDQTWRRQTDVE